ncbi:UNVERIFIED_CONTAM: hypothetical protein JM85_0763 [Acetobacter peroxydans]
MAVFLTKFTSNNHSYGSGGYQALVIRDGRRLATASRAPVVWTGNLPIHQTDSSFSFTLITELEAQLSAEHRHSGCELPPPLQLQASSCCLSRLQGIAVYPCCMAAPGRFLRC